MKIYAKVLSLFLAAVALNGCAHGLMRGSVAMKISDQEAHVCMGDDQVKAGDKVALFKNVCRKGGECQKVRLGEGEVTRTLNNHYSVVKIQPGVTFEEGTIVEKF